MANLGRFWQFQAVLRAFLKLPFFLKKIWFLLKFNKNYYSIFDYHQSSCPTPDIILKHNIYIVLNEKHHHIWWCFVFGGEQRIRIKQTYLRQSSGGNAVDGAPSTRGSPQFIVVVQSTKSAFATKKHRLGVFGGEQRIRTADPLLARQVLQPTELIPQNMQNCTDKKPMLNYNISFKNICQ